MQQLNEMYFIDISGMEENIDFEVITDTIFGDHVERFYGVDNHDFDEDVIQALGLGVVQCKYSDLQYMYSPAMDSFVNEIIRTHIYYQLTHPDFDHVELDQLIFGDEKGVSAVLKVAGQHGLCVLSRLREIFNQKKGNVIAFTRQT